jgi:hypothetical protein
MQALHKLSGHGGFLIRVAAAAAVLLAGHRGYADILSTTAKVRPNNSLLVDVRVTTSASVERVSITYETTGVEPRVSRLARISGTGSTTIIIGTVEGKPGGKNGNPGSGLVHAVRANVLFVEVG